MIVQNNTEASFIRRNGIDYSRVAQNGVQLWSKSGLPSGYILLEYIESNNTQYIDTGFKANNNTRVVLDAEFIDIVGRDIFGGRTAVNSKNYAFLYVDELGFRSDYNGSYSQYWDTEITGRQTIDKNKRTTTVAGISKTYGGEDVIFQCDYNLYLFASNRAGNAELPSSYKMYSCQIYDNGTLVRNYIPCMNYSGICGLFDKVNKIFYSSASGTEFAGKVANNLPRGYTALNYIESSDSQYIDTKFCPNQDTRLVMDLELFEQTSYAKCLLGERNTTQNSALFSVWIWEENQFRTDFGPDSNNSYLDVTSIVGRYILDKNKNVTTINGVSVSCTYVAWNTTYSIYLFSNNYNNTQDGNNTRIPKGRIYSCQIYDSGALVRDYIPCMNPNGVCGLYDKVNKVFYESASDTEFIGA